MNLKMNLKISLATCLLMTLTFMGCGNKDSSSENTTTQATQQPTSPAPNAANPFAEILAQDGHVRYLGQRRDVDGTLIEGFAISHPRRANERGGNGNGRGGKPPADTGSSCFSFLAGSKIGWRVAEPYLIDPTNNANLDTSFVINSVHQAIWSWDSQVGTAIFGPEVFGVVNRSAIGSLNGQNELIFASIAEANVIAVTYIWGIFSGNPRNRELREWDMVFDDSDFQWGNAGPTDENNLGNTGLMDLSNILVHEFGHALGLGHPTDDCTEESMFRFATEGETKKRTLHAGDIAGVQELYN